MLYDPKWEAQTKVNPLSLAGLIEWLERQPQDGKYEFSNCRGACLLDQYLTFATGKQSTPSLLHWEVCGGGGQYYFIAGNEPRTFGAALERARDVACRVS